MLAGFHEVVVNEATIANNTNRVSPIAPPTISAERSRRVRASTGAGTNSSNGLSSFNGRVVGSSTGDSAVYMVGFGPR